MIFIAGDWENDEKRELFYKAEEHLVDTQKYHSIYGTADIVNSRRVLENLPELSYQEAVDIMLHLLSFCDTIYMLKGWENSNDIKLLHDYASNNNYRIIYSKKF